MVSRVRLSCCSFFVFGGFVSGAVDDVVWSDVEMVADFLEFSDGEFVSAVYPVVELVACHGRAFSEVYDLDFLTPDFCAYFGGY